MTKSNTPTGEHAKILLKEIKVSHLTYVNQSSQPNQKLPPNPKGSHLIQKIFYQTKDPLNQNSHPNSPKPKAPTKPKLPPKPKSFCQTKDPSNQSF